jgi:hypothetical protein
LFSNDKNNSEGRWPTFPVGHPLSEFTETLGHDRSANNEALSYCF